jgi:hypothetical protein
MMYVEVHESSSIFLISANSSTYLSCYKFRSWISYSPSKGYTTTSSGFFKLWIEAGLGFGTYFANSKAFSLEVFSFTTVGCGFE